MMWGWPTKKMEEQPVRMLFLYGFLSKDLNVYKYFENQT